VESAGSPSIHRVRSGQDGQDIIRGLVLGDNRLFELFIIECRLVDIGIAIAPNRIGCRHAYQESEVNDIDCFGRQDLINTMVEPIIPYLETEGSLSSAHFHSKAPTCSSANVVRAIRTVIGYNASWFNTMRAG
jgi:hypothetical protein